MQVEMVELLLAREEFYDWHRDSCVCKLTLPKVSNMQEIYPWVTPYIYFYENVYMPGVLGAVQILALSSAASFYSFVGGFLLYNMTAPPHITPLEGCI